MNKVSLIVSIVMMIVFIILSAVFSCADMVYGAVSQPRLKKRAQAGGRTAGRAYALAKDYSTTISTVLFANNLVNIGASSLATIIGLGWNKDWGVLVMTIILLLVLLLFGEIVPKAVGRIYSYRLALLLVYPLWFFKILFFPVVWLTSSFARLVAKPFSRRKENGSAEETVSDDELQEMVDTIEEEGVIDEGEGELLRSAIEFRETEAYEIMTPRVDVYAINVKDDLRRLIATEENALFTHSRVPVYKGSIDHIIGFVSTKIILKKLLKGEVLDLRELLMKPAFVPRSMLIKDILAGMKKSRQHLVIVKDEYGGTEGLLTSEDILEELVGDIWDEDDVISKACEKIGPDRYLIDGAMNLDDLFTLLDVKEDEETGYASVGGWCIDKLGRFAKEGDSFAYENITVDVKEVKDLTVEKVIVTVTPVKEED